MANMLHSVNPDILIATDTHHKPDVASQEVLAAVTRHRFTGGIESAEEREDNTLAAVSRNSLATNPRQSGGKLVVGSRYRLSRSRAFTLTDLDKIISHVHTRFKNAITGLGGGGG